MGEVSICAAWKVLGIKNKTHIGSSFPQKEGKWKIEIFERSQPEGGWKRNTEGINKQLREYGHECYIGKGECLN